MDFFKDIQSLIGCVSTGRSIVLDRLEETRTVSDAVAPGE